MNNEMTTDNMSNEEVIEVLKGIVFNSFDRTTPKERQALHLAIKSLKERPQGILTEAEKKICKMYLEDLDKTHTCNEYRLLMSLIDNALLVETLTIYEFKGCDNCELDRPKGEWIVTAEDNDGVHRICCPFCSYEKGSNNTDPIVVTFTNFPKFCENCGADMQKGGAE